MPGAHAWARPPHPSRGQPSFGVQLCRPEFGVTRTSECCCFGVVMAFHLQRNGSPICARRRVGRADIQEHIAGVLLLRQCVCARAAVNVCAGANLFACSGYLERARPYPDPWGWREGERGSRGNNTYLQYGAAEPVRDSLRSRDPESDSLYAMRSSRLPSARGCRPHSETTLRSGASVHSAGRHGVAQTADVYFGLEDCLAARAQVWWLTPVQNSIALNGGGICLRCRLHLICRPISLVVVGMRMDDARGPKELRDSEVHRAASGERPWLHREGSSLSAVVTRSIATSIDVIRTEEARGRQ